MPLSLNVIFIINSYREFFVKLDFADGNPLHSLFFAVFYGIGLYDIHQNTLDVQRASYQLVVKVFAMLEGKRDVLSLKVMPVKDVILPNIHIGRREYALL